LLSYAGAARQAHLEQTGEDGISLPDPVTMSIAVDLSAGTQWSTHCVNVETHSESTRGMTVVDRLNVASDGRNRNVWARISQDKPSAKVCSTIETKRWKQALFSALG